MSTQQFSSEFKEEAVSPDNSEKQAAKQIKSKFLLDHYTKAFTRWRNCVAQKKRKIL
ncbi:hypothetical protein DFO50_11465 [Microvirgula sp. AG722]|uniref:hypothetical protein n=1 Tax=Microvirgula sp. AG722 TaxID=2183901 RepID=UPI000DC24FF2|nr:hypothetical protein [Microvirgula sp. AG722]RAS13387.1 hypothetical protein DFO50_11465 [Microvirgula sp. AG722]